MATKAKVAAPVSRPEPATIHALPETPTRSTADVLAGRLTIRLAGVYYGLPVLTIGQNEDWVASLDAALEPLVSADDEDLSAIVAGLESFNDQLLGFIWSYDVLHVLPDLDSIRRDIYPYEVLRAVMEIRAAANPTLGFALASMLEEATRVNAAAPLSMLNTSSSPGPTGGRSPRSATH